MAIRPIGTILFALLLAGCSTADDFTSSESVPSPPSELAFVDADASDSALELALIRPASFLPGEISLADQSAVIAADLYFDGLVEATGGNLTPALASSWKASDDFRTWTFTLDEDRTTAAEVLSTFDGIRNGDTASQTSLLLDHVMSIKADGETVTFELDRADAGFAWLLSGVRYSVVGTNSEPTGAYVISESETTTKFNAASARDVNVTWINSFLQSYEMLSAGDVDAAPVGVADLPTASDAYGRTISSRSIVRFYVANIASEIMAQPDLREAVVRSIDREALVSLAPVRSYLADGVVATSMSGFRVDACDGGCSRDTTFAGLVLEGLDTVPKIRVGYVGEAQGPAAQSIVTDLEFAGFSAEAVQYNADGLAAAISAGEVELYAFGLIGEATSVDAVLPPLLHSISALSPTRMADPALDQLIEKAAETADDEARWDILDEAQRLAISYSLFVPVTTAHNELVWSDAAGDVIVRADGSIDRQSLN